MRVEQVCAVVLRRAIMLIIILQFLFVCIPFVLGGYSQYSLYDIQAQNVPESTYFANNIGSVIGLMVGLAEPMLSLVFVVVLLWIEGAFKRIDRVVSRSTLVLVGLYLGYILFLFSPFGIAMTTWMLD